MVVAGKVAGQTRTSLIIQDLRQRIVAGEYAPGSQLPSWDELEQHYQVTRTTLNRVFSQLKGQGFVYTASTRGTFVVEAPPHLYRYVMAFPEQPGAPGWNRFWWTLANESVAMQEGTRERIACYYRVDGRQVDNEGHNQIVADVEHQQLAGVILVGGPTMISPVVWAHRQVPKVGLWDASANDGSCPGVYVDRASFTGRALDYLASRGRKRVAIITTPTEIYPDFADAAAQRGLTHLPHWQLAVSVEHPQTVRPIVRLLLSLPAGERPDGLILADDNLAEHALAAWMVSGVRAPEDLDIVVHCNWPRPVATGFPLRRLGFDVRQILRSALEVLSQQRRGEPFQKHTSVPALFEDEVGR